MKVQNEWQSLSLGVRILLLICLLAGLSTMSDMLNGWTNLYGPDAGQAQSGTDYVVHWTAGRLAQEGLASSAYSPQALHDFYVTHFGLDPEVQVLGYAYPPVTFLFTRLLALADYSTSATLFFPVSLLLFLGMACLWRGLPAMVLAFGFSGLWICLNSGQVTVLIAAVLGSAFYLLGRKPVAARILAGVLIGLVCIKPQIGVLLPLLLLIGGYKQTFLAALMTVLLMLIASLALDGVSTWQAFRDAELATMSGHLGSSYHSDRFLSVFGLLARSGYTQPVALFGHWMSAVLAALLAALIWQRTTRIELRTASALLATFLVSPMFYGYDLSLVLIALLALLRLPRVFWPWSHITLWALFYLLPFFSVVLTPLLVWMLLVQVGSLTLQQERKEQHA